MPFFCSKSGVRIVAPGVALSAAGEVPEYVHGDRFSEWAEEAAHKALRAAAPHPVPTGNQMAGHQGDPTEDAKVRALAAALAELDEDEPFAGEPEAHFAKRKPKLYAEFRSAKAPWPAVSSAERRARALAPAASKAAPEAPPHDEDLEEGPPSKPGTTAPPPPQDAPPPKAEQTPAEVPPPAASSAPPSAAANTNAPAKPAPSVERPKRPAS